MKVYITAPFMGDKNKEYIDNLCHSVRLSGFVDFCFVRDMEKFSKIFTDSHILMQSARDEVIKCDLLLLDYDGPATGRMIEVGIAYALHKPIVIIVKNGTFIKDTVTGVADLIIEYDDISDIVLNLSKFREKIHMS